MNETDRPRSDPAGFVVAALLLALAAVMLWDAWHLQIAAAYGLGPQAMPVVVATGLVLLALGNAVAAFRGRFPPRDDADPKPILLILGALVVLIVLIGVGAGFIPATALLFAITAAAFGRRAFATDLIIGLVLATIVYFVFAKLLALSLPTGPLERLM
jgi:putative tricarboxylic transport membrane protein